MTATLLPTGHAVVVAAVTLRLSLVEVTFEPSSEIQNNRSAIEDEGGPISPVRFDNNAIQQNRGVQQGNDQAG